MKQSFKCICFILMAYVFLNCSVIYADEPLVNTDEPIVNASESVQNVPPISVSALKSSGDFAMILTPGSDNKIHSATVEEIEALSSQMVSLDYTNVNLHDVLRAFANSYNLNIVLTKDIAGKVSAQLKDQSVDDALDAILAVNNYGFVRKGNIIYVMPKADMDPIIESIPVNYIPVKEAQVLLGKASALGEIQPNEATNSLIVRGTPSEIRNIKEVMKTVDVPPIQVLIEAKIVDISRSDIQKLGTTINLNYSPLSGHLSPATFVSGSGTTLAGTPPAAPSSLGNNGDGALYGLAGNWQYLSAGMTLDALITKNKARVLASPSIATLNGKEASITIGEKFPYQSSSSQNGSSSTTNITFADIGTKLRVTPTVSSEGWITLKVHPEVSSVKAIIGGNPNISTREADTIVRVKDNETIVIGGLINRSDLRDINGVPVLKDIPIFGWLFQRHSTTMNDGELTVFITPHIIPMPKKESGKEKNKDHRGRLSDFSSSSHDVDILKGLLGYADSLEKEKSNDQVNNLYWSEEMISTYRSILQQFPQSGKSDYCLYKIILIYAKEFGRCHAANEALAEMKSSTPQSPYISVVEPLVNACLAVSGGKDEDPKLLK